MCCAKVCRNKEYNQQLQHVLQQKTVFSATLIETKNKLSVQIKFETLGKVILNHNNMAYHSYFYLYICITLHN